MLKTSKIILYDEPTVPEIQLEKIKEFLSNTFPIEIETRKNFFEITNDEIFEKIASTRIYELKKQFQKMSKKFKNVMVP